MISYMIFCFMLLMVVFCFNMTSFLNSLLILESMSLFLFFLIFVYLFTFFSIKSILFYFVFIVSESSIGLSILVKSVKSYGFSSFRSMNLTSF